MVTKVLCVSPKIAALCVKRRRRNQGSGGSMNQGPELMGSQIATQKYGKKIISLLV